MKSTPHKKISPSALISLKDALSKIYWYKNDLRCFLNYSLNNKAIVSTLNWTDVKYEIISQLIDRMNCRPDLYLEDMLTLLKNVCEFNDFSHFDRLPGKDGEKHKNDAENSIKALRKNCEGFFDKMKSNEKAKAHREQFRIQQAKTQDYNNKIENFKNQYYSLVTMQDSQQRGYALETFLNDLFTFFDMSPRSSFKINGEQIDGAFTHDNNDYLLEAKWHSSPIARKEIDVFEAEISRKLKTTLGLFVSINGFVDAVLDSSNSYKSIILMDSQDLIQVLERRITLNDLILFKRRHASETGQIMYRVST